MGEGLAAPGRPTLMGDLLSLLAAVLWGATTVFVRATALKRGGAGEDAALSARRSRPSILPPASLSDGRARHHRPDARRCSRPSPTPSSSSRSSSYIAWFWLVRNYPPTRVSAFTFLSPVFGVMAGNLMLGEAFTPSLAAALALIAFGIYLVNRRGGVSGAVPRARSFLMEDWGSIGR